MRIETESDGKHLALLYSLSDYAKEKGRKNKSEMSIKNETKEHVTNSETLHDFSSLIVLIVSIIGVSGNTLTVCAFHYAKTKKQYQFHIRWNYIVVFIWNLALVDLISSINMTILYVSMSFFPNVLNQYSLCVSIISLREIFILISATSIACIAVVTLFGVTKNNVWMNFCDSDSKVCLLISFCWILGVICYIAKLIKIADTDFIDIPFTDNEGTFDCGTFFFKLDVSVETLYSEFILHTVVFSVIIMSYGLITIYACRINSNVDARREGVYVRDQNASKMVFLICSMYILQCVPYMVCRLFFANELRPGFFIQFSWPAKISYILYYTQYFPNIFIYVARNQNYRNAYIFWIKSVFCCHSSRDPAQQTRENTLTTQHPNQRRSKIESLE